MTLYYRIVIIMDCDYIHVPFCNKLELSKVARCVCAGRSYHGLIPIEIESILLVNKIARLYFCIALTLKISLAGFSHVCR